MSVRKLLKKSKDLQTIYDLIKIIYYTKISKKSINNYLETHLEKKLHLGCGTNILNDWLNTDYGKPNLDVVFLDVIKPYPLPSQSFDFILAEHLIEHIHYSDAKKMLAESYRVLKKGGTLRIGTPSLEKYIQVYQNSSNDLENAVLKTMIDHWIRTGFYNAKNYRPSLGDYNPAFFLNDIFLNYEHKFIYNYIVLKELLEKTGFTKIKLENAGLSTHPQLNQVETHIDEVNSFLTLTIEAQKL